MIFYNTKAQIPVLPSIPKGKAGILTISPLRVGVKNSQNLGCVLRKLLLILFSLNHYSRYLNKNNADSECDNY